MTRYRHVKRGTIYVRDGLARMQISPETLQRIAPIRPELATLVCAALERVSFTAYHSIRDDEQMYFRPETEFMDGRFVEVPS